MDTNTSTDRMFAQYSPEKMTRFQQWLSRNSAIYEMFKRFALEYRGKGYTRCSAALLAQRVRWECQIEYVGTGGYKIMNDYIPMMARQLAVDDPSYAEFFSYRGRV